LPVLYYQTSTAAHVVEQIVVVIQERLTRLVGARPDDDCGEPAEVRLRDVVRIEDRKRYAQLLENWGRVIPHSLDVRNVQPRRERDVDGIDAQRRRTINPLRIDVWILNR